MDFIWFLFFCVSLEELSFLSSFSLTSWSFFVSVHWSFPLFLSCRICSNISLISCSLLWAFFSRSLSTLKLYISTIKCFVVSSTWLASKYPSSSCVVCCAWSSSSGLPSFSLSEAIIYPWNFFMHTYRKSSNFLLLLE